MKNLELEGTSGIMWCKFLNYQQESKLLRHRGRVPEELDDRAQLGAQVS